MALASDRYQASFKSYVPQLLESLKHSTEGWRTSRFSENPETARGGTEGAITFKPLHHD